MKRHGRAKRAVATSRHKAADSDRVVARPDGYYWVADDGRQEFGPFETAAQAAVAAREAAGAAVEQAEMLQQAEADIGLRDRVDHDVIEVDEQTSSGSGER